MATIEARKSCSGISYRAKVRVKGHSLITATFTRKTDAKRWAAGIEADIHSGRYFPETHHTLADAIERYTDNHLCQLKDMAKRSQHLRWWNEQIGHKRLAEVRPDSISKYRAVLRAQPSDYGRHQGNKRSDATVNRYVASLSAMYSCAVNEWEWVEKNPCTKVKKLRESKGRTRFLSTNEIFDLLQSCRQEVKNPEIEAIIMIALTTGMRRGEILGLRHSDIDRKGKRILIRESKNGESRSVPLVGQVLTALNTLTRVTSIKRDAFVFALSDTDPTKLIALDSIWRRVRSNSGLADFRFHDLRHTAASYLAMSGAGLREIGDILGHKTLAMVKRYSHLTEDHKHETVSRMADRVLGEVI